MQFLFVIEKIVLCDTFSSGHDTHGQFLHFFAAGQGFDNLRLILRLHLPKGHGAGGASRIGIGDVKIVFQALPGTICAFKHSDPFCAAFDPAPILLIPPLDLKHRHSVRALGVNQHLFVKPQPEIPAGGAQKRFPFLRGRCDP